MGEREKDGRKTKLAQRIWWNAAIPALRCFVENPPNSELNGRWKVRLIVEECTSSLRCRKFRIC